MVDFTGIDQVHSFAAAGINANKAACLTFIVRARIVHHGFKLFIEGGGVQTRPAKLR